MSAPNPWRLSARRAVRSPARAPRLRLVTGKTPGGRSRRRKLAAVIIAATRGRCRCVAADIGGRSTASGQGNGLVAVVMFAAELGFRAAGVLLPGADRGQGPERVCVSTGHRLGLMSRQDCQSVQIYAFDQCPRQDSNLRSRLRSQLSRIALTCRNVLSYVLPGRASGATRLVKAAGHAGWERRLVARWRSQRVSTAVAAAARRQGRRGCLLRRWAAWD
jgi:hypothetical protein